MRGKWFKASNFSLKIINHIEVYEVRSNKFPIEN